MTYFSSVCYCLSVAAEIPYRPTIDGALVGFEMVKCRGDRNRLSAALSRAASTVDIYRVPNAEISNNWHLEDYVSLMQRLGVGKP